MYIFVFVYFGFQRFYYESWNNEHYMSVKIKKEEIANYMIWLKHREIYLVLDVKVFVTKSH